MIRHEVFMVSVGNKILSKKFKSAAFVGYDHKDVDTFFDEVVKQIKIMESEMISMRSKNNELNAIINKLNADIERLSTNNKMLKSKIIELQNNGYGQKNIFAEFNAKTNNLSSTSIEDK